MKSKLTTKDKENYLIKKWYNDDDKLTVQEMQDNLLIDGKESEYEIGNFLISKDNRLSAKVNKLIKRDLPFLISIINDENDLYNNPISQNKEFLDFLKKRFNSSQTTLTKNDLMKFYINDGIDEIEIANFILSNYSYEYTITLADEGKDEDGKIHDQNINIEVVISHLEEIKITKQKYKVNSEVDLNKYLENELKKHFKNVEKSKSQHARYHDLMIGNGEVVIEIKLARALAQVSEMQRAIGQIIDYKMDFNGDFIILVIGTNDEKNDANLNRFQQHFKKDKKVHYYFKATD